MDTSYNLIKVFSINYLHKFWFYQIVGWIIYFIFTTISAAYIFPSLWISAAANGTFSLSGLIGTSFFHLACQSKNISRVKVPLFALVGSIYFVAVSAFSMALINSWLAPVTMNTSINSQNWPLLFTGTLKYSFVLWSWMGLYLAGRLSSKYALQKDHTLPDSTVYTPKTVTTNTTGHQNGLKKLSLKDTILLDNSPESNFVRVEQIIRIEADGAYSKVYTKSGKSWLFTKSLKHWERKLDRSYFKRVHRSHIVNLLQVEQVKKSPNHTYQIFLKDSENPVPMSRRYGSNLKLK